MNGKLHGITASRDKINYWYYQSVVRNIRLNEVVLARLHLGHTIVTHSYFTLAMHHSLHVTSFWIVAISQKQLLLPC